MGRVSQLTRDRIRRRDHSCVAALLPGECRGHLDAGHLVGRGMGGTPEGSEYDGPGWVVLMCREHNRAIEDHPDTERMARDLGLHYPRNSLVRPPRAVVMYPDGVWYVLDGEGGREPYSAPWLDKERTIEQ